MEYQDKNAETIDRWIEEGWEWGIPISHEEYEKAQEGDWGVLLTPTKPVPKEWFKRKENTGPGQRGWTADAYFRGPRCVLYGV